MIFHSPPLEGGKAGLSTEDLLLGCLLYVVLPLWVIFGFIDYLCHRASKIEQTTGIRESFAHTIMGFQVGAAIFAGFFFQINVLILLVMVLILVFHELVAHWDIRMATRARPISIWETHAHSFLEVLPFSIFVQVVILSWPAFINFVSLKWSGHFALRLSPFGSGYMTLYFAFMFALGILPYGEELLRCYRASRRKQP